MVEKVNGDVLFRHATRLLYKGSQSVRVHGSFKRIGYGNRSRPTEKHRRRIFSFKTVGSRQNGVELLSANAAKIIETYDAGPR